jgi:RNA polymerase sigma-70 factor (ECF subfamily)
LSRKQTSPAPNSRLDPREEREAFVHSSYAELFQWFCRLTGSSDRAADLTQETFAAFWESLDRIRGDASHRTWLYAIGRNLWRNQIRDRKVHDPAPLALVADGRRAVERAAQEREFREAAEMAVGGLPEDLREAFTLRFWHEFEYDEIAAIQRVSPATARWRYFAARRRLHEALSDWDPRHGDEEDPDA